MIWGTGGEGLHMFRNIATGGGGRGYKHFEVFEGGTNISGVQIFRDRDTGSYSNSVVKFMWINCCP